MSKWLEDKCIVIIGGTSGIGLSAAQAFLRQGAKVICFGLETSTQVEHPNCQTKYGDILQKGAAESVIDLCLSTYGQFDGLYHVAGGSGRQWGDGALHELRDEGWSKTIELNLTSVMMSNRAAVRSFLAHKQPGAILNVSSLLASHPSPTFFSTHAYTAAKSGIIGFSKAIAGYYAKDNIRVNVIAPALTNTPMAKRAMARDDIKSFVRLKQQLGGGRHLMTTDLDGAACYFLSEASKFTTGQVLTIDGGWMVSDGYKTNTGNE